MVISNPNKVFWPDEGYTKGDLCAYYAAIAEVMLPFLHERPVVLVRYPDGIAGKNFFQWNVPVGTPDWIERIERVDEDDPSLKKTLFLVDSADALVHIANLGCIPLHVLAARRGTLDQCDFLTVDFDIADRPFSDAVRLALDLRVILDDVGLVGFPKTSGQKGLHVLVPLGPGRELRHGKAVGRAARAADHRQKSDDCHDGAAREPARSARVRRHRADRALTHDRRAVLGPFSSGGDGLDAHQLERAARSPRYLALHHAHVARSRAGSG